MKNNEKGIVRSKLKKTKNSNVSKRVSQRELSDLWKEIRLKLKPLSKAFVDFKEKRLKKPVKSLTPFKKPASQPVTAIIPFGN